MPSQISDVRRHVIFSSALGEELNKLTTSVPTLFNLYINVVVFCINVTCCGNKMSLVVRKPVFGFPTRSDTNRSVQPQKMARGLKFRV